MLDRSSGHRLSRPVRLLAGIAAITAASGALLPAAAGAASNHAPIGHLDSVVVTPGGIQVNGWTADTDTPHSTILIVVTTGVASKVPNPVYMVAHNPRSDVAAAYPALGPNHGFNFYFTTAPGSFPVCVSAQDLSGKRTPLGCRLVSVPADRPAIGHLDSVRSIGNNHLTITGWALDPDLPTFGVTVNIVLGAADGTHAFNDVRLTANQPRPDVGQAYPAAGPNHGFALTVAAKPGTYPVCAYAFDKYWLGNATLLGCTNVTV